MKTRVQVRKNYVWLIGLLVLGIGWVIGHWLPTESAPESKSESAAVDSGMNLPRFAGEYARQGLQLQKQLDPETVREFTALKAKSRRRDQTVWAQEKQAQRYGEVFVKVWDSLRQGRDPLTVLGNLPFNTLLMGQPQPAESLDLGIDRIRFQPPERKLNQEEWRHWLIKWTRQGYRLEQSDWRQPRFEPAGEEPAQSRFVVTLHVRNPDRKERLIIQTQLRVVWRDALRRGTLPVPDTLQLMDLQILRRQGAPAYQLALEKPIQPNHFIPFIDPLILYDLNRDGLSEIILACKNRVLWNHGHGRFETRPLLAMPPTRMRTGCLADFDGDGNVDFMAVDPDGLLLYQRGEGGELEGGGERVWRATAPMPNPFVMTTGDIDGDRDLDIWLGQYKMPYEAGQMPTPFYDANDGFPAYLLINQGQGEFIDGTAGSGLAAKRFRRTYSASFADLDEDRDLDLVVVSDFAGIDLYTNDGRGRFRDVTSEFIANPYLFGMAHSLADFDGDNRLDLYAIGMDSPTADRLDYLGLGPDEPVDYRKMRPEMAYGNRLYLGRENGFRAASFQDQVAQSGWSWGTTAVDFDNDGDRDIYTANGHRSRESAREYDPQFWCHDIYLADSEHNEVLDLYFHSVGRELYGQGCSYGGHRKNPLYMNLSGQGFVNVGYLMGVALDLDCRNVVSDDLDGDGRMDLLVTSYETWPERRQALYVFRNTLADAGNWIGFDLHERGDGFSPVGAKVVLQTETGQPMHALVTGDSYRAQHATTAHFGLGDLKEVQEATIHWPNGQVQRISDPEINRYHEVLPDKELRQSSD